MNSVIHSIRKIGNPSFAKEAIHDIASSISNLVKVESSSGNIETAIHFLQKAKKEIDEYQKWSTDEQKYDIDNFEDTPIFQYASCVVVIHNNSTHSILKEEKKAN